MTQKITPCLWFDGNAEEAAAFYTSIFQNSELGSKSKYDETAAETTGQPKGSTMVAEFEIAGQKFVGLNGGPKFKFNEATSFMISCKDQDEIDYFWSRLTADGGEESQCCWLKDKFGLSWQVIPENLNQFLGGADPEGAKRATAALLKMQKPDIQTLRDAYAGK
jgi:predicted 3-demethylubiquinone-9 3-methyltransferase (glyoxalase superfamily)